MKESESSFALLEKSVTFTLKYFLDVKEFTNDREVFYQYWMQHLVGATVLFQRCLGDSPCAHVNSERVLADTIIERRSLFGDLIQRLKAVPPEKATDRNIRETFSILHDSIVEERNFYRYLEESSVGSDNDLKQNEVDFIISMSGTIAFFLLRQIESRRFQNNRQRTVIITRIVKSLISSGILPLFRTPNMTIEQGMEEVIAMMEMITSSMKKDFEAGFFRNIEER